MRFYFRHDFSFFFLKFNQLIVSVFEIIQVVFGIIGQVMNRKVPILNKMPLQIDHNCPFYLDSNIVPWHSWLVFPVEITLPILSRLRDTSLALVVKISPFPKSIFISDRMIMCVPSSIADIQSSHKSNLLINDDWLFMVRPQLRNDQSWMSQNFEVLV